MSAVTVIGPGKRPEAKVGPDVLDAKARARLAELRSAVTGKSAAQILAFALDAFPGKLALVSSFGSESAVLLHLLAQFNPDTPVLFLNTGKLFGETLRYRDRLQDLLGLGDLRTISPHAEDRTREDPEGTLWSRDPDRCCALRKVVPLSRLTAGFDAVVTGRKRFQTSHRAAMETIEFADGRFRINPLADWSQDDLEAYRLAHHLPAHPLVEDGYPSIGCMPCTRRVAQGEGYRDGRWAGLEKTECGIHTPGLDGEGI